MFIKTALLVSTLLSSFSSRYTLPRITPTITPLPSPTLILTSALTPSPTPTPVITTLNIPTYLLIAVNDYRRSQNLSEVTSEPYTCNFAKVRAGEISVSFNHDGFRSRIDSRTLPYPSYSRITENIALNSSYKAVVPGWINSPGHAANMQADTPFVCIQKYGNYYAYEGWKP
ncbi:MAG: hypothetical protein UX87_C0026G0010 [Candidatus Amesbacteria bacterium GW2011_GWA1_47_16]|uniref:SCP domain-containing protein n=4 Tax=Candidatus Amesiibacteriota TaxID=1752730 RepID=A0A0G1S2Q4_9BACT|nr:MAG: hypothetical protein UX87_C0026G0010 [Candidatus Amesbacteria bacterium GW2011_GWA1_47_16]KKU63769.1 MAG: hypothetical protein UX86_C0018G0005 [Candidatus Amesbacteria bacterium GW2011_GWC1_47_15]OGC99291.1 MAG: hypothetical protein A2701_01020 [Candidatus Amesbacteria bacterium RIFCSPHIGHO2_01_FULL_47_34]OGC99708.1 MAG: hypothetical protein A2972_00570 [Candidatus Amesbacteria bacterium RIFCSPLOWO2_01_FULL_47_33]